MIEFFNNLKNMEQFTWIFDIVIKIGLCVLFVVLGGLFIKISAKAINKTIMSNNKISERKAKTLNTVCASIAKYLIYFFVGCALLTIFGVKPASLITIAGFGSVAVGFGAQSLVQDLITGVFILIEDQFGVGDVIAIETHTGTVESIGIRTTRIRSADGNLYIVPNGQIKVVTNMSKGFNRAVVDIGISYEENIDRAISIMKDEMKIVYENNKIEGLISVPDVLGVVELGENSVDIRISADSRVGENWQIEREIRRFIKNRFDKEGICIPYPQRVVHVINQKDV